ncbi:hypothetical protein [uncultured Cetobacterium sp.]|uniref:hypothetical protein n=1 Tax=uncultured Cetobacterium sp. TaxID=527638 RepID=UPI00262686B6|nr:hypothetical protein [uncultured Cetobacterium sp.]
MNDNNSSLNLLRIYIPGFIGIFIAYYFYNKFNNYFYLNMVVGILIISTIFNLIRVYKVLKIFKFLFYLFITLIIAIIWAYTPTILYVSFSFKGHSLFLALFVLTILYILFLEFVFEILKKNIIK